MTSKSSRRWLKEHFSDTYVKQAQKAGYRSRAVFKLQQIQEKDHLFQRGMTIIDLGAAPGGWSQYVSQCVRPNGRVIAMDILAMDPLPGVEFIQGDIHQEATLQTLRNLLNDQPVDWVISDMAPNLSGIDDIDIPRAIAMAELALAFALEVLAKQGGFLVKVFHGVGFDEFIAEVKKHFQRVVVRKPKASRGRSREVYVVARERKQL